MIATASPAAVVSDNRRRLVIMSVQANCAAHSVCSPPQPNPGLPGFGRFKFCRKRASPQPAGGGWGVGVLVRHAPGATTTPPPRPAAAALRRATLPTRGTIYLSEPLAGW